MLFFLRDLLHITSGNQWNFDNNNSIDTSYVKQINFIISEGYKVENICKHTTVREAVAKTIFQLWL